MNGSLVSRDEATVGVTGRGSRSATPSPCRVYGGDPFAWDATTDLADARVELEHY
ncbi:hypothetical protein ACFQJD_04230 [Haloplanus sp. GCM10025708]|uniref:hypothetical protein n=1 Tax=Haloplanus sp. GCM10025708 TaxID=3252679 RepID=UPI00360A8C81